MLATQISIPCAQRLVSICETRYQELLNGGCDENVAADRVFDALNCALEQQSQHCFDPRDRLFENILRTTAEKGR